ncbi:MAG: F0F1 ATP synthase subunit A [Tepidisphaerales bacterium]
MTDLLLAEANPLVKVVDHVQVGHGLLVVTNHMILLVISAVIMLLVFPAMGKAYEKKLVPSGLANFLETILLFLRDNTIKPLLGDATDRFLPYLWTIFFFILINNLLGLLPLYELTFWMKYIGLYPIYGTATGNIFVTAALALTAFIAIQAFAIKENGIKGYLAHLTAGTPVFVWPIMVPVEIMGMFIKPIALTMRLFANMLAGGLVLKVLVGFVPLAFAGLGIAGALGVGIPVVLVSVAITALKLFVAFLQAFLFMFLTTLFIAQMAAHHDDHGHGDHAAAHDHAGAHGHAVAGHAGANPGVAHA